jgi:hypothetical protein
MGWLAAAGCCRLLLATAGCCWLLLAANGCCWLLLTAVQWSGEEATRKSLLNSTQVGRLEKKPSGKVFSIQPKLSRVEKTFTERSSQLD